MAPKLVQVPAVGSTPEHQQKRTVVVPQPNAKISWKEARKRARAYIEIMNGAVIARGNKAIRSRPHRWGNWWMTKLADLVEKQPQSRSAQRKANRKRKGLKV